MTANEDMVEFDLLELRVEDGGEPDDIHHLLLECFNDDDTFDWTIEQLNELLAQCARKAVCGYAEEDETFDADVADLLEDSDG